MTDDPVPPHRTTSTVAEVDGLQYRQLNADQVHLTLMRLRSRINERFPSSGLSRVAGELLQVLQESTSLVAYLRRPHWPLRVAVFLVLGLVLTVIITAVITIRLPVTVGGVADGLQVIESAVNDLVFLGIMTFFLVSLENRIKRRRALAALHELRSVAHIVDMHQLTKDPERLTSGQNDTASSPVRTLTRSELGRYLDYCSELLSIISKIAALHVQSFNDAVVLAAVNEIEGLTSGLSAKIWQKITLLGDQS